MGANDIMIKMMEGKKCDIAEQGFFINYELSELATCVARATEAHKKK